MHVASIWKAEFIGKIHLDASQGYIDKEEILLAGRRGKEEISFG
jgi:hypothetical protein